MNILNKLILNTFNYFITLNNIIILSITIFIALIIKKIKTEFNFQN